MTLPEFLTRYRWTLVWLAVMAYAYLTGVIVMGRW
jgi:hypothetical protein